jgi:hypothetical protein
MKRPKWPPRDNDTIADTIESVITAGSVVLLLATLGAIVALFANLHVGLRVGDILVFKPETSVLDSLSVTASRSEPRSGQSASATTCTLDPKVMAHDGGSIVVEARSLTKPVYRVHWAGTHTSTGAADCGSSVDLTVSRMDLQTLVNAIGGFSLTSAGNVL